MLEPSAPSQVSPRVPCATLAIAFPDVPSEGTGVSTRKPVAPPSLRLAEGSYALMGVGVRMEALSR